MSKFYTSLILFFFYSVSCLCSANVLCLFICIFVFFCNSFLVLQMFYAPLFIFSFVLCPWLGLPNVLCLFIYIVFLFFCVFGSVFCHCSMPLYL